MELKPDFELLDIHTTMGCKMDERRSADESNIFIDSLHRLDDEEELAKLLRIGERKNLPIKSKSTTKVITFYSVFWGTPKLSLRRRNVCALTRKFSATRQ